MKYLLFLFYLCTTFSQAQYSYRDFAIYQGKLTQTQIAEKISKYLQKNVQIEEHYSLDSDFFSIYVSLKDKQENKAEFRLKLAKKAISKTQDYVFVANPKKPLLGLKVALDPGHIGGPIFSKIEHRYVHMHAKSVEGKTNVAFHEGQLATLTAIYLRDLLVSKGAQVFLTREKAGVSVYHQDFFTWLQKEFLQAVNNKVAAIKDPQKRISKHTWWLTRASLSDIFRRIYNPLDLLARAQKINRFRPHLTLIIHYNAGGKNDKNGLNLGAAKNYNMAFVPGSFMKGELSSAKARYEFARLAITNDLENSIKLSEQTVAEFSKQLKVPNVDQISFSPKYLTRSCMPTKASGVYARNLTLTRLVHGTICYGETLCQDNYKESQRLAQKNVTVKGIKTSGRVILVAQAYFNAIIKVYGEKK